MCKLLPYLWVLHMQAAFVQQIAVAKKELWIAVALEHGDDFLAPASSCLGHPFGQVLL